MTLLIIVGSVLLLLFLGIVVRTIFWERQLANLPPTPPFLCPRCQSAEIEIIYSGLWDGIDAQGERIGGMNEYGACKQCESRCARIRGNAVGDRTYIPSEQEWDDVVQPMEKERRQRATWPFID